MLSYWGVGGRLGIGRGFELRSVILFKCWLQVSHPGSKKCKLLTPGALLLVKRTQQMIKSPYQGQPCNVKSPAYTWPPPSSQRVNIDRCITEQPSSTDTGIKYSPVIKAGKLPV